jgi:hypothetical protein
MMAIRANAVREESHSAAVQDRGHSVPFQIHQPATYVSHHQVQIAIGVEITGCRDR